MSNILYITASIRSEGESVSRALGQRLVEGLAAQNGASVVQRDLAANDIPYVSAERFAANLTPAAERTPEQAELAAYADQLIAELQAANTIVLASPVYNFGPPATLKAWADLVARAGTTFQYTANGPEGLLKNKKVIAVLTRGGLYRDQPHDTQVPYLRNVLGFLGITDVSFVYAEGLAMGPDAEAAALASAREQIAALLPSGSAVAA